MSTSALKVHPDDNIIVALRDLGAGQSVDCDGNTFSLGEEIPAKHKFAADDFLEGDEITMYGVKVGIVQEPISRGGRIHTENVVHAASEAQVNGSSYEWSPPSIEKWKNTTFQGYHRDNGSVGTANYWIVVPLVFCENRNLELIKRAMLEPLGYGKGSPYTRYMNDLVSAYRDGSDLDALAIADETENVSSQPRLFPNVDGIKFLSHTMGCGGTKDDAATLAGLLAGYITHPNVAGATVLSLGCQKTQIEHLKAEIDRRDPGFSKPVFYFEQQKSQSEKAMLSDAIRATFKGVAEASELRRQPAPLSKLSLGVECGGSDGFSGISANPVVGGVSDRLIALGGSVVLSEFPELCGVEQSLVDRCVRPELGERFLQLMKDYDAVLKTVGSGFDQNPSPGNIADGLTTDAIKSAGAALKGGTAPIEDVFDYPEWIRKPGLSLLCTPGGDVESTTAMAGAGANVMMFSTGLGTPTGNPVTPVMKISSNSVIAEKLSDIIDFDTGPVIGGSQSIDELADALFDLAIQTASGEYEVCAQLLGQDDFIPWKRGLSL
ncbi:MAG: altronate hydrolase [Opitutaceae bacterium]|nr:altronate hydrolase [Opitutaceae bacterium]